jgi:hypothetical protein
MLSNDGMNLVQIKRAIRMLSLDRLRKLDQWLHEAITEAEEAERAKRHSQPKGPVADQTIDNRTYRLESVRCGREKCKCSHGKLHGPYWYSYTRVKDKLVSQYIGKRLPKDIERRLNRRNGK